MIGRVSRDLSARLRRYRTDETSSVQDGRERHLGAFALAELILTLVAAPVRRISIGEALHLWLRKASGNGKCPALSLGIGSRRALIVTSHEFSAHIMADPPHEAAYVEGRLKQSAMSFLAPNALTVSHGEAWFRRRAFNERILSGDAIAEARTAYLAAVQSAFALPLQSEEDIRERMRTVMLTVLGGPGVSPSLASDIEALIAIVNSPLRRVTTGRFAAGRRQRFFASLRHARDHAPANSSLLGRLRQHSSDGSTGLDEAEAIEQVPHWMFPFSGSATDLLARTLAMIGSRPEAWHRIEQELAAAGDPGDPSSVDRLPFVEACILETGRLYPPVTRTFHAAPSGAEFNGLTVPPRTELVHLFPLIERNPVSDPAADEFQPERWLGTSSEMPRSNLFLSGRRACPGRDLILFLLKGAVAAHVTGHHCHFMASPLARDPLPYTFPRRSIKRVSDTPSHPAQPATTR